MPSARRPNRSVGEKLPQLLTLQGEAARDFGVSEAAARKRYQRAARKLREHFDQAA